MIDCYAILGVPRKARLGEIKRAYRRLARQHHPDLNPGDPRAEDRFKRISEAYETLSDGEKRRKHDRELEDESHFGPTGVAGRSWGRGPAPDAGFDLGDLGGGGSGLASFFSEIFNQRPVETQDDRIPRRGDDVTRTRSLGFFDALRGLTDEMTVETESACTRCDGSGRVPSRLRRPCPDCAGTGRVSHVSGLLRFATACRRCGGDGVLGDEGCGNCEGAGFLRHTETIAVHIPAGVDSGSRVRVPGKGRAGRHGGAPGDLYIVTQVAAHPFFTRIGDNIHCTVPITVTEAALGARIKIPTIDGQASVKIPPGTETGRKFRLRGKGAPLLRGSGRGDQYVEVHVVTPRAADEKSRQLLRELGGLTSGEELRRGIRV